jgi:hypothetical protein
VPPVVITSLRRFNQQGGATPIEVPGISSRSEIKLSYRDKILLFEFAALSYLKSDKNEYAYKLEGFQEDWITLGKQA